jgi:hypothetical protein
MSTIGGTWMENTAEHSLAILAQVSASGVALPGHPDRVERDSGIRFDLPEERAECNSGIRFDLPEERVECNSVDVTPLNS